MFTAIRLQNFKSYDDSDWIDLRPLTFMVGPNNAGKSTILHAILLFKQTLQDRSTDVPLVTAGQFVELGTFKDMLRSDASTRKRDLKISVRVDDLGGEEYFAPSSARKREGQSTPFATQLEVAFRFNSKRRKIELQSARFSRDGEISVDYSRTGGKRNISSVSERVRKHLAVHCLHFLPVLRPTGPAPRSSKLTRQVMDLYYFSRLQANQWQDIFKKVSHVDPLRLPIPWYVLQGRMPSSDIGAGGEHLLRLLASPEKFDRSKQTLATMVDHWISERFNMLKHLHLRDVDELGVMKSLVGDEVGGPKNINLAGMGEGISQLLPIVAQTISTGRNECLLVEQPEIHLHPAAQADLGDLFVDSLKGSTGKQFIIETHSEHLLLRVRRRIAEGALDPKKVAILFVEKRKGGSNVRLVELSGNGHFEDWPDGFFEEGYREALALAKASAKRNKKAPPKKARKKTKSKKK